MRQDGKHQAKRRARQEARLGHPALCDLLNLARVEPILGPRLIRGVVSDRMVISSGSIFMSPLCILWVLNVTSSEL